MSTTAAQRERLARWLEGAGGSRALAARVRAGRPPGADLGYDDRRLWLEGAIGDLRHARLDEGSVERVERLGLALGFTSENVEGLVIEVFRFPIERLRAYAALGLAIGAPAEEVKATHRVIAKALHPDRLQAADAEARRAAEQLLGRVNHARATLLSVPAALEPDPPPAPAAPPTPAFQAPPEPVETERIPRPPRRPPAGPPDLPPGPPPALFFGDDPPTLVPDEAAEAAEDPVDVALPPDPDPRVQELLPDELGDDPPDDVPLVEASVELPPAESGAADEWIELDPPSEPGLDAPLPPPRRRSLGEPSIRLPPPLGIEPETELELEPVALPEGEPIPDTDISDLLEEVAGPRPRPPRRPRER